jgi:signal transduction histidine kinase
MKNISIIILFIAADTIIYNDPLRLQQILINLISNAIKF